MAPKEWLTRPLQGILGVLHGASRLDRVAVLLDGDNVSSTHASAIFDHAVTLGRVASAHLYANFSSGATKSWAAAVLKHRISAHQCFAQTSGRNATDIALVVSAMDLLRDNRIESFVIASSDSDFSALARRIAEAGRWVHGIGAEHTPTSFRTACTSFLTFKQLHASRNPGLRRQRREPVARRLPPTLAADLILVTLLRMGATDRWVSVADLGQSLKERDPTFHPTGFGRNTLTRLLGDLAEVELDRSITPARVRIPAGIRNG